MGHRRLASLAFTISRATRPVAASAQDDTALDLGPLQIDSADAQTLLGNDEVTDAAPKERNPAFMADVFAGASSVAASGSAAIAQRTFLLTARSTF